MNDLEQAVYNAIQEFAKRFQQTFWLKNAYCMSRTKKHHESVCIGCESHMMCNLATNMLRNEEEIMTLQESLTSFGTLIEFLTVTNKRLLEEVHSLQKGAGHETQAQAP